MSENNNTYFIDPESASEMARLIEQDRLFKESFQGNYDLQTFIATKPLS